MNDVIAQALADAELIETGLNVKDEDLKNIAKLADEKIRLEDLVEALENKLSEAKKSLTAVTEYHLPDAMISADLKSIELNDGSKLTRSIKYIGNISKANEEAAFQWFKDTKRAGVVTTAISMPIGKGRMEEGEQIAEELDEQGYNVNIKHSVHWQTLRSVVREMYENGEEIPDCISTHVINETKIKRK